MIPFSFQKGNKTSGCEDAPPIATPSYSIVCDGLGGSGATKHSIMEGDNKTPIIRTSGYLGSRIVCDCVNEYYAQNLAELESAIRTQEHSSLLNTFLSGLKNKIEIAFDEKMKEWGIEASKSNTLKDFPTTLASSIYMPHSNGITVLAVWAGDSRVYVLEPEKGLRLLSLDDAKNADNKMNSTSEMTNCISAGNAFHLNYALYEFKKPGILFCCSDGCFDNIKSPLHFEWLLLTTILECVPISNGDDLGAALADSIRDNMYITIGDDTTMAGIIAGIESSSQMKNIYKTRMAESGELAVSMNEQLKVLKNIQSERDMAQKTCRLFEEKIITSLHDEVCKELKSTNSTSLLRSRLLSLPCCGGYTEKVHLIEREIDDECNKEIIKVQDVALQTKNVCRNMVLCDFIKWQRQDEDQNGYSSFWGQLPMLPQKTRGLTRNAPTFANPQNAIQSLQACKEMYKHPYFREVASLPLLSEEELTQYIQSQIGLIEALIAIIDNDDQLFLNLWSQAFFSTEFYAKDRTQKDKSPQFESIFEQVLINPRSCQFISELSIRKIEEYQSHCNGITAIREKFQREKQRRLDCIPEELWIENKDEILKYIMSESESTLHAFFSDTLISMERLLSLIQAKRTLAVINQKIESAQNEVNRIWEQYKGDYQLFSIIAEKGAC